MACLLDSIGTQVIPTTGLKQIRLHLLTKAVLIHRCKSRQRD